MEPILLRTEVAEFVRSEFTGNTSGYIPIGDRILVKVDEAAATTSGGVYLPDDITYKMTMAAETGVIVAMGDAAFYWTFDRSRLWHGYRPKVGDHVYLERYAGRVVKGKDSTLYRVMDDKCIACVSSEDVTESESESNG
jgi:co-chaperonin GroES (HSP10)